jgi:hypothetical protein
MKLLLSIRIYAEKLGIIHVLKSALYWGFGTKINGEPKN